MRLRILLLGIACLPVALSIEKSARSAVANTPAFACPTTTSPEKKYGNQFLSTILWPKGKVIFEPGGSGFVLEDGALAMKFPWWRLVEGQLTIEGHRLDGPAAPLRASVPDGYGATGFQSTALIFPAPGCWEVTGRVGGGSLTFVTQVVKIGEGPERAREN